MRFGLRPEQVTLISPRHGRVPGLNPFRADLPVVRTASDFVDAIHATTSSWGPRMGEVLVNAAIVIAEHRLSVLELYRFLALENYRTGLLELPLQPANPTAYAEARSFFLDEMAAWGKAERATAAAPVLSRLRECLRSGVLGPLFCTEKNTVDFGRAWREQQLLLVHVDRAELGDNGARVLSSVICQMLFRTALSLPGDKPVLLVVDELATLEAYVGKTLVEIVTVARSLKLPLFAAFQHLSQISPELREALLSNTAVQTFFRLGFDDSRIVANALAAGAPSAVERVVANFEKPTTAEWPHQIYDPAGQPLRLPAAAWQRFQAGGTTGVTAVRRLYKLAAASGIRKLYVHAADTGQPTDLRSYLCGTDDLDCEIVGPRLGLTIRFPRPKLTGIERTSTAETVSRWIQVLQNLPIQRAVIRIAGAEPGVVKIADVILPETTPAQCAFVEEALGSTVRARPKLSVSSRRDPRVCALWPPVSRAARSARGRR